MQGLPAGAGVIRLGLLYLLALLLFWHFSASWPPHIAAAFVLGAALLMLLGFALILKTPSKGRA